MSRRSVLRFAMLKILVPELVEPDRAGTLLYVGCCEHRCDYSSALRQVGHQMTALEIWQPAIEALKKSRFWSRFEYVICGDVRKLDEAHLPHAAYDYSVWWHGPEHVNCGDVAPALRGLEKVTKRLVVLGSPWGIAPNRVSRGNPYTAHRCYLYYESYARLKYKVCALGPKNGSGGSLIAWKWLKRD